MRKSLAAICESFIQNRNQIKMAFGWESAYLYPVCAAIFINKRQTVDIDQMKRCQELLKKQTGIFSNFRGIAKLTMISMLAADNNPDNKLQKALQVYGALKEYFFSSPYLPVASMIIADIAEQSRYNEIAARTRHI